MVLRALLATSRSLGLCLERSLSVAVYLFFFLSFFYFNFFYCISFAKYQNESATCIHVFPILNPPPSFLPISSLWVVPVYQPQASSRLIYDLGLGFLLSTC